MFKYHFIRRHFKIFSLLSLTFLLAGGELYSLSGSMLTFAQI